MVEGSPMAAELRYFPERVPDRRVCLIESIALHVLFRP